MERLDSKTLALDIAVNLDRVGRFLQAKRTQRVQQFLNEIKNYSAVLQGRELDPRFANTFDKFVLFLNQITPDRTDIDTIDDCYTFSTILQNRAKLL